MRVLAFDTATRATTVAALALPGGEAVAARDDPAPGRRPNHTSRLLGLIVDVLQRAGWGWGDVDRIAVGTGPGTFTGLRIGVATARALAHAREIELVGVSTLQSLALGAAPAALQAGCEAVMPVLDARRGEAFAAVWALTGGGARALGPSLLDPVALPPPALAVAARGLGRRRLAVGDGAVEFAAALRSAETELPGDDSDLHKVSAIHHCRLAGSAELTPIDQVRPQYLRQPDAQPLRA